MKRPGSDRRGRGARPGRSAARPEAARPPEAALGRGLRGLVGPDRGVPQVPARRVPDPVRREDRKDPWRAAGATARTTAKRRGGGESRWTRPVLPGLGRLGRIVTPARAAGLLGMLASGFLLSFVTGPAAFGLTRVDLPALRWTDPEAARAAVSAPTGGNVFRLDTAPLEAALGRLPAVEGASVTVQLPDAALVVTIAERVPVLAWQVNGSRFLIDSHGTVFATADPAVPLPADVGVVDDRRVADLTSLAIGDQLDAVELDVATRLGSLTPSDVGSTAARLRVAVTDEDGFIVTSPDGWTAVFGLYSPATRPTDLIPGQVRLLRSLLVGHEATVRRIVLASETDGTYVPAPTPKPTRG